MQPLHVLHVYLHKGRDLPVKDASGSSDPYVKFSYKKKLIYRSYTVYKSVNPQWDEKFSYVLDDLSAPLKIEVYDYDRFSDDDFMGCATVDLSTLGSSGNEVQVVLQDKKKSSQDVGYLVLTFSISPAEGHEREKAMKRFSSQDGENKELDTKTRQRSSGVRKDCKMRTYLVRVVVIGAKNLRKRKSQEETDFYVKLKLGEEKCRSKTAYNTFNPQWLEPFSMHLYDGNVGQKLEVMVVDDRKDTSVGRLTPYIGTWTYIGINGRCTIDLSDLATGTTTKEWYHLEDGGGHILISLSLSGKLASRMVLSGSESHAELQPPDSPTEKSKADLMKSYNPLKIYESLWDIGFLTVKVYKARDLTSADIGKSSDPFCVLELVNARLETHTEHKTLNPEWNTLFTFHITDIHSVLDISVFDEDKYKKSELLGKVAIPLLNIKDNEKHWYRLKDGDLKRHVKGEVLIEMELVWNPVRAAVSTFLPAERKYGTKEQPFQTGVFMRNVDRLNEVAAFSIQGYKFFQRCLAWENPIQTLYIFLALMLGAYYFQPYMIPLGLLGIFTWFYINKNWLGQGENEDARYDTVDSDDENDINEEKNWKVIRNYMKESQLSLAMMQNTMEFFASLFEKVKNIFAFKQPFVSILAIIMLCGSTVALLFIPLRWIMIGWLIKKFSKQLRRPHSVPSNELLDFISRSPSDKELRMYHGFK